MNAAFSITTTNRFGFITRVRILEGKLSFRMISPVVVLMTRNRRGDVARTPEGCGGNVGGASEAELAFFSENWAAEAAAEGGTGAEMNSPDPETANNAVRYKISATPGNERLKAARGGGRNSFYDNKREKK